MSRKRGKLSLEDEAYIRENAPKVLLNQVADALDRTEETILKYCKKNNIPCFGMSKQDAEEVGLLQVLHSRPYWNEVKKQFDDIEIDYFATSWIHLYKQFNKDGLLYSEELQLKQMITQEIMGNRILRDRKKAIEQEERLQEMLDDLYGDQIDLASLDPEQRGEVSRLESDLNMIRSSMSTFTKEHSQIQNNIKDIQKDLKAARSDRIKRVEDSKTSFSGLLKYLEDEHNRTEMGINIELMKMAKDKKKVEMSQLHKFEDGFYDQPLLTPETLIED